MFNPVAPYNIAPSQAVTTPKVLPPPWTPETLESYCDQVNQGSDRGVKYQNLLDLLSQKIREPLTVDDFTDLGDNLLILIEKMPSEIKDRSGIRKALETIYLSGSATLSLLRSFCEHLNNRVGIRTKTYQEILEFMRASLQSDVTSEKLELIGRCVTLIVHNMPAEIKKNESLKMIISSIEKQSMLLLKNYCISINNNERGNPLAIYQSLLNTIKETTQSQTTIEELHRLSRQLKFLIDHMPIAIKQNTDMNALVSNTKLHLMTFYRQHFHALKDIVLTTKKSSDTLTAQSIMGYILNELPNEFDPALRKEMDKYFNFSNKKFLTRKFVEHRSQANNSPSASSSASPLPQRKIYPILSIDGGGIKGIIPAKILIAIEQITRQPISRSFRMIGGTSTGGILALGLTKPNTELEPEYRARDLLELYTQQHNQIFRENPNYQDDISHLDKMSKIRERIWNPKYRTPNLFRQRFGTCRLSSALTDVLITTNTFEAIISKVGSVSMSFISGVSSLFFNTSFWSHDSIPREVHLFTKQGLENLSYSLGELERGYEFPRRYSAPSLMSIKSHSTYIETTDDLLMADVAKATSAAPSFFPPFEYSGKVLMDGGVLQNNPSIPCILDALDRGHKRDSLFLLSLGTGEESNSVPKANFGTALTSLWFKTCQPDHRENFQILNMLDPGAYYRFQHKFQKAAPDLDNTLPETITELLGIGDHLVEENLDQIVEVCRVLNPDCT